MNSIRGSRWKMPGVLLMALSMAAGDAAGQSQKDTRDPLVQVRFRTVSEQTKTVNGRLLVRAQDGGLLVEDRASRYWTVTPDRLIEETAVAGKEFSPLSRDELGRYLIDELRAAGNHADFFIHATEHYVLCTDTSPAYAQWCGGLLERLYKAFRTYWSAKQMVVHEPEFLLPVIILKTKTEFAGLAAFDRTPASAKGHGYFLITANRIVLYDLTGTEAELPASTVSDVLRRVRKTPSSVAAEVHEATHQMAFNTGLHRRYADNPMWMTEGLAMYFETPDLKNRRGWQTIGRLNSSRKLQFQNYVAKRRPPDSLETLIRSDARFHDPRTIPDAYAEAWALSYYLIRTRPRLYTAWLAQIAAQPPLRFGTPEDRLKLFRSIFGEDLESLDQKMLNWIRRQR